MQLIFRGVVLLQFTVQNFPYADHVRIRPLQEGCDGQLFGRIHLQGIFPFRCDDPDREDDGAGDVSLVISGFTQEVIACVLLCSVY